MSNEQLREALQQALTALENVITRVKYDEECAAAIIAARQALATTEPEPTGMPELPEPVANVSASSPVDELEAFTNDTKDALMAGRAYAQEALIRFDDAYDRHPSTEPDRNAILTDIQLIDAAMAKGAQK